jgi:hypothetical protein
VHCKDKGIEHSALDCSLLENFSVIRAENTIPCIQVMSCHMMPGQCLGDVSCTVIRTIGLKPYSFKYTLRTKCCYCRVTIIVLGVLSKFGEMRAALLSPSTSCVTLLSTACQIQYTAVSSLPSAGVSVFKLCASVIGVQGLFNSSRMALTL